MAPWASSPLCFKVFIAAAFLLSINDCFLPVHERLGRMAHERIDRTSTGIINNPVFATLQDEPSGERLLLPDSNFPRRQFLATSFFLASSLVTSAADAVETNYSLPWENSPVNRRSGVTVFDAEKAGYNVAFVTYLSRFLLTFDSNCQRWWFSTKFPNGATAQQVEEIRLEQFARFSASVEVGLQGFVGKDGPATLLQDLVYKYGRVSSDSDKAQKRLAQSARRHIALCFGLLEKTQPVKEVTRLLALVDNARIRSVEIFNNNATGFDEEPSIEFSAPLADNVINATGRAQLKPTGRLLRIDVVDGGTGYQKAPTVTISSPRNGTIAVAKAILSKSATRKGQLESVQLIDAGSGYESLDGISVEVSPPEEESGKIAIAQLVLDKAIDQIEINDEGSGYAVEKPVRVYAVVGDNRRQVGVAKPVAESSSFSSFRKESDLATISQIETELDERYNIKPWKSVVSGSESASPPSPFWSKKSSSSELLRLLPAGVGLEYDSKAKRYVLAVDSNFVDLYPAAFQLSNRPVGTEFGPRGRAPIERDRTLGLQEFLRFGLSGAICASGVHLALTPLDVVKTKVQVNPAKYSSIGSSFGTVLKEEGASTFFTGWLPTVLGNFVGGGILYAVTEIIRRSLTEAAGTDAISLEVPIILCSAALASALGAIIICPFEAVRIRTVAQPDYAPNSSAVLTKMLDEEGIGSLVNAIPIFLVSSLVPSRLNF